jgi:hypothetical protein
VRSALVIFVVAGVVTFAATAGLRAARQSAGALTQQLSHAQFASDADDSCLRTGEQLPPVHWRRLRTTEAYMRLLHSHVTVLDRLKTDLSGLEPPEADSASFQLMLSSLGEYLRTSRNMLRDFAAGRFFYPAAIKQGDAEVRLQRLSRDLGLNTCRQLWQPHLPG